MRRRLLIGFAFSAAACLPPAAALAGGGRATPSEITQAGLREHLQALQTIADQNGGNRASGRSGFDASAVYVARRLSDAGWRVRVQRFPFLYWDEPAPPRLSIAGGRAFAHQREFATAIYSGSGTVEGPLRRVGNACRRLRGFGSGLVAFSSGPGCDPIVRARNAQRAGAEALVLVEPRSRGRAPFASLFELGIRIPVVVVNEAAGRDLNGGTRVQVSVNAIADRRRSSNVIAETRRSSGGRTVMAGGHLDSVTKGPGINDNGSGVSALLELADALGGRSRGRPVRLAFWGAEEQGLWGSWHYADHLSRRARRRIAAYVNLDMVGSPNPYMGVYNKDGARSIERLLRRLVGRGVRRDRGSRDRSDHAPFKYYKIPAGGLHTGAGAPWDPCYHQACDTIANVNLPVLERMARVAASAVQRLARR